MTDPSKQQPPPAWTARAREALLARYEEEFLSASYVAIGTMGRDATGAPEFREVWWPGYVRQRMAQRVRFDIPPTIDTWPVIGETQYNVRGARAVRVNTAARIDRHGKIRGLATFPRDRWLEAGDHLNIDFNPYPQDPPGDRG